VRHDMPELVNRRAILTPRIASRRNVTEGWRMTLGRTIGSA
jgi:hypothetical protein